MAKGGTTTAVRSAKARPRCLPIADAGIATGREFAQLMSALIGDIAAERIDARAANAICNAGGKLLKIVEMQHKFGGKKENEKVLTLAAPLRK